MNSYLHKLEQAFNAHSDPENTYHQQRYMKNHFEFLGLKAPVRREIQRPFLHRKNLPTKQDLPAMVEWCWNKPEREFQYFAQELVFAYHKHFDKKDITLIQRMITRKSWWDTVDFIAAKIVGAYFKNYPESREKHVHQWLSSGNIWLQRTSLLFQLHYKDELDKELLTIIIQPLTGNKEFFINKAIGWILRQISKTDPDWVKEFVERVPLDRLSYREATKLLK